MLTKKTQKTSRIFICKTCDFTCSSKGDYNKHLLTAKHKKLTDANEKTQETPGKRFICICGKEYKQAPSLTRHKKKCKYISEVENTKKSEEIIEEETNKEDIDYKDLFKDAMKAMKDQQEQINKMIPLIGNNTTNNNITNNNTNNFNLNIFLNETCKDALNLTDFINSIQVQLKDLEYTTDNGHIKGITNIFHNALSNMEENKRPMHCTDLKRETLYIKDNDEWHKDEEKDKIKEAVDKVTNKNISNSNKWLEKYPEHINPSSKDFEKYIKMTTNSMGTGDEVEQKKIVKNILKEVVVDKTKN
jgi:hypothetical protein